MRCRFNPCIRKIPWRSKRPPTSVWAIVQRIAEPDTTERRHAILYSVKRQISVMKLVFFSSPNPYFIFGDLTVMMFLLFAFLRNRLSLCVPSCFRHAWLFVTPWTIGCQAPLSMGFRRQDYWNGLSCPLLGDLPNTGTELMSLMSPALTGGFFITSTTWEAHGMG